MTLAREIEGKVQGISLEFPWSAKQQMKSLRVIVTSGPYPAAQRCLV